MKKIIILLSLSLSLFCYAQSPCENNFSGQDLTEAEAMKVFLNFLQGADLTGANLQGAQLPKDANLQGAQLPKGVQLPEGMDLTGANLQGAQLPKDANLQGAQLPKGTDLRGAKVTVEQAEYLTEQGFWGFVVVE